MAVPGHTHPVRKGAVIMTETKWESWEELNNLPDDKKKDLILWMLTTQDELVNEVEQEHQQEIQMKKLMKYGILLRCLLKNRVA